MGIPQLEQCCCGCQLRTGTKFVGWISVIFGTLAFIYYVLVVVYLSDVNAKLEKPMTPGQLQAVRITLILLSILTLFKALFAVLLLLGVYKGKISYYKPWLIYSTVALVLEVILIISMIVQGEAIGQIIGQIIGTCIYCYFILVVYSDYREQGERSQVR